MRKIGPHQRRILDFLKQGKASLKEIASFLYFKPVTSARSDEYAATSRSLRLLLKEGKVKRIAPTEVYWELNEDKEDEENWK